MGNLTLSLRTALISTGIVSIAVIMKLCAPLISNFIVSDAPAIYSIMLSYLRPPYLYLLINCIILSIVVSTKLNQNHDSHSDAHDPSPAPPRMPITSISSGNVYSKDNIVIGDERDDYNVGAADRTSEIERAPIEGGEEGHKQLLRGPERSESGSNELSSLMNDNEKPSVSRRFGGQRKSVKYTPEGKVLGVAKAKRLETLESTWKTITEGRPMPLTRHLKKSDTWERAQKEQNATPPPLPNKMKKSETFSNRKSNDTTTTTTTKTSLTLSDQSPASSGKLRRELSLSQDELNRRVEAFIKKFNEEMRLQRQESLNQYQQMISQGHIN